MTVKEKHLKNGVIFRDEILNEYKSQEEFIKDLNNNLIYELVGGQIDDPEIKFFIYDTIVCEDFEKKKDMAKEILDYLVDDNNELIHSAGLDLNTDQAILAYKLLIFSKLDYEEENNWNVEIHFKKNYSHPKIVVEKISY